MHETPDDLEDLQQLLDSSYDAAGAHLREVITPDRRMTAEQLAEALTGMRLLVLATVTRDGRPINGPVDSFFYRGRFHFGSSPESIRFRHIAERPWVSGTHLPGEELQVTVHGRATPVDVKDPEHAGFRKVLIDNYGKSWEKFLDSGPTYARIDPDRMFTFFMKAS